VTDADVRSTTSTAHHGLAAHEVVLLLGTDRLRGLSEADAADRLRRFGPNLLPEGGGVGALRRWLLQFHHPLIYVLLASAALTLAIGEPVDASVILAVVLVNALVGYIQESKAEAALDALRAMVRTRATVVRDGTTCDLPSDAVVPGDLVLVEAGDKVPADLRLVRLTELRVDESALTGESVPVVKDEVSLPEPTPVAARRNMVYSGTLVTSGVGAGVVVATGAGTELGEIHRLVGSAQTLATPLTRKLTWFSKVLTVAILALAGVTFAVGTARGEPPAEMLTAAVALAVGAIPEGLPAAVTITLAIGVSRMARRRAVIRRLPAVETLGSTTVVCSDKTGTLTENQMTVRTVWTPDGRYDASGSGYAPEGRLLDGAGLPVDAESDASLRWCLVSGAACNDARLVLEGDRWGLVGDPTEGAMLVAAGKAGIQPESVAAEFPRAAVIPFTSHRRYMATVHRDTARGGHVVFAKGASERVVDLCSTEVGADGTLRPLDRGAVLRAAEELAGQGLRVLATAAGRVDLPPAGAAEPELDEATLVGSLTFVGLQAMLDPPRSAAAAAVRSCHLAGISVKMITGDHAATARAVADQVGLLEAGRRGEGGSVLTGEDLAALPADAYPAAVEQASVLARVSPEQKLRLVEALQARHHVVAMTGDGVNDAPALRRADIGVAMGRGGTEVAKDAADMVLLDDDFATIEAAVEEGRGVFDNLTKFIAWTLPTNMAEGFVILVAVFLGNTLPILPVQILWINMTTAVALGLMLAFEPKEAGIMSRAPRSPDMPLLTGALVLRILLVSALLVVGTAWLFESELAGGASAAEARTAAMNLFVTVELFYLFSCRSLTRSMWHVGVFSNHWIIGGVTVQIIAQAAITYLGFMNQVFHTAPVDAGTWLQILALATVASAIVSVDKRLRRGLM
jgi:cation-transporting ATPase F